jgi:hypothetical protein
MAEEMTERGRMIRSAGKGIWEKQTPKALPSRRKRGEKQVSSEGLYPRPLVVSLSHASFLNCQSRERAREIGRGKEGGRREINRRRESSVPSGPSFGICINISVSTAVE